MGVQVVFFRVQHEDSSSPPPRPHLLSFSPHWKPCSGFYWRFHLYPWKESWSSRSCLSCCSSSQAPVAHPMPMDDMKMMDDMEMPMDDMKMGMEDMPMPGHYMPSPSPAYHVTPTYQAHPEPAYKAHPKPVYHSKLAYAPVVHHNTYHPTPAYHHVPAPAYHHAPAPAYHAPKHNCSIVTEMEKVEVCTPAFETKCMNVDLMVKKIVDKEQCSDITRTVCMESVETIPNEICTYTYMPHSEDSVARTVDISFEKDCMTQMVTVCQPKAGYGYHCTDINTARKYHKRLATMFLK